jgi:hypothetical protein
MRTGGNYWQFFKKEKKKNTGRNNETLKKKGKLIICNTKVSWR